ncbi:MAG: DUF1232 domain-containing protein [Pseudomonadota bacterium]|nr:DUF1232 domain-containing protein [Pseudomonadota bacterium]
MRILARLKAQANALRQHTVTVYFAARDPRTPISVRLLAAAVAAYALSPIDLIPDFIPVLGYLDDLLLIPLGLALVIRLTPAEVIEDARMRAQQVVEKPVSRVAAALIAMVRLAAMWLVGRWLWSVAQE